MSSPGTRGVLALHPAHTVAGRACYSPAFELPNGRVKQWSTTLACLALCWSCWPICAGTATGAVTPAVPATRGTSAVPRTAISPSRTPASTNAPAGFRLAPGFRIELVAAEPLLTSPIALAFDERGRLFVIESPPPTAGENALARLGRVRVLEEADDQGVFRASTIYADAVPRASAVACYHGGVFVAATPDILYLKDRAGDNAADLRSVVLTGFGIDTNTFREPVLPNNLNWGLDHRIHGASGGLDGTLIAPTAAVSRPVALARRNFAFDPRTLGVVAEAGTGETGLSFDDSGRRFTGEASHLLRQPVFEPRYYARNPWFPAPPETLDAAEPATRVFRWDTTRVASQPGDRALGPGAPTPAWVTAASGCVLYRGGLFPTNYLNHAFVPDPDGHLIHHLAVRENGLTVEARRPAEERATEFLVSTDPAFRPTQIVNGPDGALYVADRRLDPRQGRVYRIVPEHFRQSPAPRLDKANTFELVAALAQTNGWMVDTAARLLYERQDPGAEQWLTNMFLHSRLPLARLRALHCLDAQGALRIGQVHQALNDSDPRVREHALVLLEHLVRNGFVPVTIWDRLQELSGDASIRVRYQLALTMGDLQGPAKGAILAAILGRDLENPWMRAAILSSLGDEAGTFLVRLAMNPGFRALPGGWPWVEEMAAMVGVRGRLNDVAQAIDFVDGNALASGPSFRLLSALGDGMHRTESSLALVDPGGRLRHFFTDALLLVATDGADWSVRVAAAQLLGVGPVSYTNSGDRLRAVLAPAEPIALQSAALVALGRSDHPRVTMDVLQSWRTMSPRLRAQAVGALLNRGERAGLVLDAIETGRVSRDDLAPAQLNYLRTHRNPAIGARARQLLGPFAVARPAAVQQFRPAARLPGLAAHGREIFLDRCSACHQLGGEGQRLGPDLAGIRAQGKDRILEAILEPSLEIPPQYATTVVETRLGEVLIGIKSHQGPASFTLRQPGGLAAVWALESVSSAEIQAWSLMPEGLEQGLTTQDMADLLEYLATAP